MHLGQYDILIYKLCYIPPVVHRTRTSTAGLALHVHKMQFFLFVFFGGGGGGGGGVFGAAGGGGGG